MVRIEEIAIKNYRVLQDIALKDIQPFSVFLGSNGSGKTTFFDAIAFLSDCLITNVRKALEKRGRFPEVISHDSKDREIEIAIKYREDKETPLITYPVAISLQNGSPIVSRETMQWKRGYDEKPDDAFSISLASPFVRGTLNRVPPFLRGVRGDQTVNIYN